MVDICVDMATRIPGVVQRTKLEEQYPGQGLPLSYTDMIKLSNGIDLNNIRRKLRIPEMVKRKDGGGRHTRTLFLGILVEGCTNIMIKLAMSMSNDLYHIYCSDYTLYPEKVYV